MRATAIGLVAIILTITVAWTALNASANTSGPNPSGYTWTDSNAPTPFITMDWIDISATGTSIDTWEGNDDDGYAAVPLPFDFVFGDGTYNGVEVGNNGFVSFGTQGPQDPLSCSDNYNWSNDDLGLPIPHGSSDCEDAGWGHDPLIAAYFDDLDVGACGEVFYGTTGTAPNRMFVVQFEDVCNHYCDLCVAGEGVTFEIILYEGSNGGQPAIAGASAIGGDIRIQYADGYFTDSEPGRNYGASATSGLSFDGDMGLPYSYGGQSLTGGLAVLYSPGSAPTETPPAGQSVTWADNNCKDGVNPVDSLFVLRGDAGLPTDTGDCPDMGRGIEVLNASPHIWGDVDCKDGMTPVDSLKILRFDAGLGVTQDQPCPEMGEPVQIAPA